MKSFILGTLLPDTEHVDDVVKRKWEDVYEQIHIKH